jgi:plasmid stabilization system protein ParE
VIVVLTAEAETDLESIAEYIARDSVTTALNVVHDLREKCLALADAPRGYPLVPRYEHHGIRRRPFDRYLIFYRVGLMPSKCCIFCTAPATMSHRYFRNHEVGEFPII